MSEQRESIKFLANVPVTVRFSYDSPKTGEKNGIPWYLWGVEKDGEKVSFFATEFFNKMLLAIPVRRGTVAIISKNQDPDDTKKIYWHVKIGDQDYDSRNMKFEEATARPTKPIDPTHTNSVPPPSVDVKPENVVRTYWHIWDLMQAESERRGEKGLPVALLREAVTSCMMEYSRKGGKLLGTVPLWTDDLKEKAKRLQEYAKALDGGWTRICNETGVHVEFSKMTAEQFVEVWRKISDRVLEFEKATKDIPF